ncbi:MAG TPA: bifunctional (p)ppGpp synthetase/guanosine-3',5'-bis(diphosphate) 3'-pyrophosphohydrolase [Spirochaetota bacterium]
MPGIELKIKSRDFTTLLESVKESRPDADLDLIERAFRYAEEKHRDQKRLSGEPYIIHPLEVAIILAHQNMDSVSIAAALLHDVVEDTGTTLEEISRLFGADVAALVDGVTKISSLKKKTIKDIQNDQAETLRKMLMATVNDARVIVIKLADKTHNMRTIIFQPQHKQERMANEVFEIYAPLAGRLGMSKVRSELEDLSFKVIHPDEYSTIKEKMALIQRSELEAYLEEVRTLLREKLGDMRIEAHVFGRVKHYYSIFRKMQSQNKTFEEIFDIRAVRIITNEVRDCYAILGAVHTLWSPVPNRFKDYIAMPKTNMYQSLHTTVIGPGNHFLELQIRTKEMDLTAELGIAAHWAYKEKLSIPHKEMSILSDINRWREELTDSRDFMTDLKMELYQEEVFVFTPKGKIVKLPKGSTPIDFAFVIHSEVGSHCVGAKINGKLSPLKTELVSGDIVEVLTNAKGHPSETWLKYVKSSTARHRIRSWLRRHAPEYEKGLQERADEKLAKAKPKDKTDRKIDIAIPKEEVLKIREYSGKSSGGIIVEGQTNVMIRLSQCCQPIPGDDIIGFVTRGRGITVHKRSCPSLTRLAAEPERFINIIWAEGQQSTYPVKIAVYAVDRLNLLKDIADKFAEMKVNILKIEADVNPGGDATFKFVVQVTSLTHVSHIANELRKVKSVRRAQKLNEKVVIK